MAEEMYSHLFARQDAGSGGAPLIPPHPGTEKLNWTDAPRMLAVNGTLFALAMSCVLMRIYVRGFMLKSFGVDDWMMMFSAALSSACFACFVALTHYGAGRHMEYFYYVHPEHLIVYFQINWWYAWIIVVAYSAIKISICFFLLRLADHRRAWRWVLYGIIVALVLFTIGSVLSLILQCTPIRAAWDFMLKPPFGTAKCYSLPTYRNTGVFNSSFNLFTDLLLALLPVPMIWKLQTNMRTRISLCIVLGLGLFACATAVYKIPLQYNFFAVVDFSGEGPWYYIWQQIEMNIGIVAACLPTLKPLAANFLGAVSALTSGDRYGSRPTNGNSRPIVSNGYLKQSERSGTRSFAMDDMKSGNGTTAPESPFAQDFEKGVSYKVHERRGSRGGESDESVLPLHQEYKRGIVRTTEVEVR